MFKQQEWPFIGASGKEYRFSICSKSTGLPSGPGIFILAYTHPRGHLAGWQVHPLTILQAEDMRHALESHAPLDHDQAMLWNSCFVLPESSESAREGCVRDLRTHLGKALLFD